MDNQTGIYGKYHIEKANGSSVDPNADYFVLRLDGRDAYAVASRAAAKAYSEAIQAVNPTLSAELLSNVDYFATVASVCPECSGKGTLTVEIDGGYQSMDIDCPICKGSGKILLVS